jgi:PAS domain-containing protein
MTETDSGDGGYFAMGERARSESPNSIRSDSMSMHLAQPSATMASFTALQYLPVPVLVLSAHKTVVLANEAMGRLFGIDFESVHHLSISEVLQDRTMGDLGVDILQNGSPILITWEVRLYSRICTYSTQAYHYLTCIELPGLRS